MPRSPDSARLDLARVFHRTQSQLLAQLSVASLFEHPSAAGHAAEQIWLEMFRRYLPQRYRAAPAFIIDSTGRRSRQIDIAIFDNLYSPLLFPHDSGLHIPAESVYAVFEVKPTFSRQWIADAAVKAASVRALHRTSVSLTARRRARPQPILAGLLAATSVWTPATFARNLQAALRTYPLSIGCALEHGSFCTEPRTLVSGPSDALLFFLLRLADRLRALGTAAPADFSAYLK